MAEARQFCPECGSMELTYRGNALDDEECRGAPVLLDKDGTRRDFPCGCMLCGWHGKVHETLGAVTTEQFYDIERIGHIMLRVFARYAAGPLSQVLVMVGLLEDEDAKGKERVLKAVTEAAITTAFEEAAANHQERTAGDVRN